MDFGPHVCLTQLKKLSSIRHRCLSTMALSWCLLNVKDNEKYIQEPEGTKRTWNSP